MSDINNNETIERREDVMPKVLEKELKHHKSHPVSIAVWFGIVFGVAASVFVGWNFIAPRFKKTEQTEVPLIRRSTSPVKVRPSDPGGMDIPNRERRVYARIESGYDEPVVETLLPPPEEPMVPQINIIEESDDVLFLEDDDFDAPPAVLNDQKIETVKAVEELVKTKEVKPEPEVVKEVIVAKPEVTPEIKPTAKVETKKEEIKPLEITPPPAIKTAEMKGAWKVQLLSVKDLEAAEKEWQTISQKHSAVLRNIPHIIEKADLGSKGIFYRLKVGGYDDRNQAETLCAKLKENKQGCFVVK